MADCYAPEADELHLRWLPREIFADIGIADPEQPPAVAVAVAVAPRQQRPPVRGMEAPPAFLTTPGGRVGNVVRPGAAPAPVAWPAVPPYYSGPVQWPQPQVAPRNTTTSYVNVVVGGGAVDHYNPWRLIPPPAPQAPQPMQMQMVSNFPSSGGNKVRGGGGGTGVFLPRADAYCRRATAPAPPLPPAAAKDVTSANYPTRTGTVWRPTVQAQNAAAGRRAAVQQRRNEEAAAAAAAGTASRATSTTAAAAGSCSSSTDEATFAMLPQEWSYQQ